MVVASGTLPVRSRITGRSFYLTEPEQVIIRTMMKIVVAKIEGNENNVEHAKAVFRKFDVPFPEGK